MKKYIIITVLYILTTIISGCDGTIIPKYRNLPNLGCGYIFDTCDGNSLAIINSDNNIMIDDIILDYAFDSIFIIASQRPWDVPGVSGIKEMTYNQRNESFEKSTFRQYWIINKKERVDYTLDTLTQLARYSNVYGPFKKEEYLHKREELGVPKELKLKEE